MTSSSNQSCYMQVTTLNNPYIHSAKLISWIKQLYLQHSSLSLSLSLARSLSRKHLHKIIHQN